MRNVGLAAVVAVALPGALAAQGEPRFSPPPGCTGHLTVQFKGCLVMNAWTCADDPEGHQWSALFNGDGPSRVRRVDAEFQWLETYLFDPVRTETMIQPAPDPESLTVLFAEAFDTYDFTISSEPDIYGTGPLRFVGYDRLTGEEVLIDGEPLLRTEYGYDVIAPDGSVLYSAEGRQYVSTRHRLFFFGESWDASSPQQVSDQSPVEFIYEGEPGFFSPNPKYDCGMLMSQAGDVIPAGGQP